VRDRRRGDQEIQVRDEPSLATQVGPEAAEHLHDRFREIQDRVAGQEPLERCEVAGGVGRKVDPFEEFAEAHDTDRQAVVAELVEQGAGRRYADDGVDQPIGVDEVRRHGRLG
jgi:phage portal protein BeeE